MVLGHVGDPIRECSGVRGRHPTLAEPRPRSRRRPDERPGLLSGGEDRALCHPDPRREIGRGRTFGIGTHSLLAQELVRHKAGRERVDEQLGMAASLIEHVDDRAHLRRGRAGDRPGLELRRGEPELDAHAGVTLVEKAEGFHELSRTSTTDIRPRPDQRFATCP